MSVTDILNKIGATPKENSDTLSTATKNHLGKIQRSYSEKFTEANYKEEPKNESVRYNFVTPDMTNRQLYSVSVFVDQYSNKIYESMNGSKTKFIRPVRHIKNQGVELSVVAESKASMVDEVEKFMEINNVKKDSYRIVETIKLY